MEGCLDTEKKSWRHKATNRSVRQEAPFDGFDSEVPCDHTERLALPPPPAPPLRAPSSPHYSL